MTNMEYIRELLEEARQEDGENAYSTQLLKKQLEDMEGMERRGRGTWRQCSW